MISHLPTLNACLNSLSAVFLVLGFLHIKKGNRDAHRRFMLAALTTSALFLASYLTYHYFRGSTKFPGQGAARTLYFTILLTHTVLATAIVPMIGVVLWAAFKGRFEKHKRLARWTLPLWIYVSVTGVVIYVMLYHISRPAPILNPGLF